MSIFSKKFIGSYESVIRDKNGEYYITHRYDLYTWRFGRVVIRTVPYGASGKSEKLRHQVKGWDRGGNLPDSEFLSRPPKSAAKLKMVK